MDAASPAGDTLDTAVPEPGDFTVCLRCARPYRFAADLVLEPIALADVPEEYQAEFEKMVLGLRVPWCTCLVCVVARELVYEPPHVRERIWQAFVRDAAPIAGECTCDACALLAADARDRFRA